MEQTPFQEVRERVSLTEFARDMGLNPRKDGKAFCPFHMEGKTPNLHLYESEGRFKCFSCQEYGDIVDLACGVWKCSKGEALLKLNSYYNLGLNLKGESKPIRKPKSETFSIKVNDWRKMALDVISWICREAAWMINHYEMVRDYIPYDLIDLKAEHYFFEELHQEILEAEPIESYKKRHEEIRRYAEAKKRESEYIIERIDEELGKIELRLNESVQS